MIFDVAREVEKLMRERGWPYRVEYGPVYPRHDFVGHNTIVVERADDQEDKGGPPAARGRNPRYIGSRVLNGRALVFVRSQVPGAARQDHEQACEATIDLFQAALYRAKAENYQCVFTGGRYLAGKELATLQLPEQWNGVCYLARFTVERGVYDFDYAGDARPEGEITSFENSTNVTRVSGSGAGTACG